MYDAHLLAQHHRSQNNLIGHSDYTVTEDSFISELLVCHFESWLSKVLVAQIYERVPMKFDH